MIAMALSCNPKLLLADEPTTALDVTIQAQILEIMARLSRELGTAVIIITHNLGVVARYADRVNVMYAGKVVETATAKELYANPRHPYTIGLLKSVPRLDQGKQGPARADRGRAAGPRASAGRLLVRAALRVQDRQVPDRRTAAHVRGRQARGGLLGHAHGRHSHGAGTAPVAPATAKTPRARRPRADDD